MEKNHTYNHATSCGIRLIYSSFDVQVNIYFSLGIMAPVGGGFLLLKSKAISSIVTNSTPSCFLKCSINLSHQLSAFII